MSKTSLKLAGQTIPLPPDTEIAINYQAHNIASGLGTRDGSYAESFVLPETNQVRRILGNSQFVTSATTTPYRVLPATIEQDGNPVITGTVNHSQYADGYHIELDGENSDLFALVKGKKLSDIDLSDLDHAWTALNVQTRNSHDPARGYLYPLINYGRLTTRHLAIGNVRFDEFYPAVYVQTLIERMIQPYKLTGSILQDARFKKLVIPFTNAEFVYRDSYLVDRKSVVSITTNQPVNFVNNIIQFQVIDLKPEWVDIPTYKFTIVNRGDYKLKATFNIDVELAEGSPAPAYAMIKVFRRIGSDSFLLNEFHLTSGNNQVFELETDNIANLNPGDDIYLTFDSNLDSNAVIKAGSRIELQQQKRVYAGGPVHLEVNLPDISQEELLLSVFNMFNLIGQTDTVRQTYRLDSLDKMRYLAPVDWSRKVDWNRTPELEFAFGEYGQTNYISYAENEKEENAERISFTIDNQHLPAEKKVFTSEFTYTETRPAFKGETELPYIPLWEQQVLTFSLYNHVYQHLADDFVEWNNEYFRAKEASMSFPPDISPNEWERVPESAVFQRVEATPRLLVLENRMLANPIYVGETYENSTAAPVYTQGLFKGTGNGISAEELKEAYHDVTERMCRQTKLLKANVRLKLPDINALDFLRPVMLNIPSRNLQGVFYLNSVNQYRPDRNQSTEVELVRLFGLPLLAEATTTEHIEFSEEFNGSEFN